MNRLIPLLILCLGLGACATGPAVTPGSEWSYGCSPQAPASYRVAQTAATGNLEVTVLNAAGVPVAGQDVTASYTAYTGYKCPAEASLKTGSDGIARFERMRVGPYSIKVGQSSGDSSATTHVEAGKTVSVTLNLK